MNTDTLIILLSILAMFGVIVTMFSNLLKKNDALKDEIFNLKIDTNNQITELKLSIKDISTNLYLINERLGILGFSNKPINNVHNSKEHSTELEYS